MAQFIPFQEGVEVNGQTVLAIVNALEAGKVTRFKILSKHGIVDPQPLDWYSQKLWLDAFREISETFGVHTLFAIGEAIPQNAIFPPEINDLKKALESIDIAYHLNHRGGEIGHYTLTSFEENKKLAIMVCNNPYPSEFDRGIITTMVKKFVPRGSLIYDVQLDRTKETRLDGAESCTYIITW
ncbi:MAG TPA: hypothetical protein VL443_13010 [Cyclobacteriaceae bacterium]|jgi:hypothetical protein|nr:hypothetical protein [Cyclobacteriaceae bacterium]